MKKMIMLALVINFATLKVFCQFDSIKHNSCDTLTRHEFTKLVKSKMKSIKKKSDFATKELLEVIKIGMSPAINSSNARKLYKKYSKLYWDKMISIACNDNEMKIAPVRGGSYYSREYDIFIIPPISAYVVPCHNYFIVK